MFKTVARIPIVIAVTHIDVSAKTGEENKLVKFWLVFNEAKLPPKYLNKSKFAKGLYFQILNGIKENILEEQRTKQKIIIFQKLYTKYETLE